MMTQKSIAVFLTTTALLLAGCSGSAKQTADNPCQPTAKEDPSPGDDSSDGKPLADGDGADGQTDNKGPKRGASQTPDQCISFTVPRIDQISPKTRAERMKRFACDIGAVQGEPDFDDLCPSGYWVPKSQEPAAYQACESDDDCIRADIPGCCSMTYVALSRNHPCIVDLGSSCEMECGNQFSESPADGAQMRAACVEGTCELTTP